MMPPGPNFPARVSKDEGASCFETHRSAVVRAESHWHASAAMLLSMRPSGTSRSRWRSSGLREAALLRQLSDLAVLGAALRVVLADVAHQRRVGNRIEHRVGLAGIDVAPPHEVRH